jgi:uncharacterized repeat protein (TIGR01451 family)
LDEYLCDGGDRAVHARVAADWSVQGLDLEDTIAHFDTVDGRTIVEPSNRVCIYSPRFAAVRQVVGLKQNYQRKHLSGYHLPTKLVQHDDAQSAESGLQLLQPQRQLGNDHLVTYRSRKGDGEMSTAVHPEGYYDENVKPHEDVLDLGPEQLDRAQMAWLAQAVQAAITWSHDLGVQVLIDREVAAAETAYESVALTYTVKDSPDPKLQIIKTASVQFAEPGQTVDFVLRFDNVGNQVIGNVTIIDNLTTRLEYVADSEQCSVPAQFIPQVNQGDSLVLRWEITDPLEPGDGGVIKFTCRVR